MAKYDLLLLSRVRKILLEEAGTIHRSHAPWGTDPGSKDIKRRHDRILREARDLGDLRKRLAAEVPPSGVMVTAGELDGSMGTLGTVKAGTVQP